MIECPASSVTKRADGTLVLTAVLPEGAVQTFEDATWHGLRKQVEDAGLVVPQLGL